MTSTNDSAPIPLRYGPDGIPVLFGHAWPPDDRSQLRVWCGWCEKHHLHGRHDPRVLGCPQNASEFRDLYPAPGHPVCTCPPVVDNHKVPHCLFHNAAYRTSPRSTPMRYGYYVTEVPDEVQITPPRPFKQRSGFDPVEPVDPLVVFVQAAWSDRFYHEEL